MLEITDEKMFADIMMKSYDLVIVDIYADWCGPCKYLTPHLEKLEKEYENNPNVLFCKLNSELQIRNVQGLPTIEFWLKQGTKRNLVHTVMGADLVQIKQKLSEYLKQHQPRQVEEKYEEPVVATKPQEFQFKAKSNNCQYRRNSDL